MAPILGRCKKVPEAGWWLGLKQRAQSSEKIRERRNWSPEFYEEQRVLEWEESGLGEGKSFVKGELWLSGEGRGGTKNVPSGPLQPSTNMVQNKNKSCLKIPFYSGWVKRKQWFLFEQRKCWTDALQPRRFWSLSDSFHKGHAPWTAN